MTNFSLDIAPLFGLLAVMLTAIGVVYASATLYYKYRQQQFWARAEALANQPETEAERAAYEQFDKDFPLTEECVGEAKDFLDLMIDEGVPQEIVNKFFRPQNDPFHQQMVQISQQLGDVTCLRFTAVEPEGDPAAAPPAAEAELKLDQQVQEKARAERATRTEVPIGVVFTAEDGNEYKYVRHPVTGDRVKIKVTRAVQNPNAIPTPSIKEMERITRHQAVDHMSDLDYGVNMYEDDRDACELCSLKEQHAHTNVELKRYVRERAEMSFKDHIQNMDLTQLPIDEVEKLWARCKNRIESNAVLKEMTRLEGIWERVANFDDEDELFFQEAVAQAAKGPVSLGDVERSPAPNSSKAEDEGEASSLWDLDDETDEESAPKGKLKAVKNPDATPMPKRYLSGISRQQAEESVWLGMEAMAKDIAEEVPEEERHKTYGAMGAVVQHFIDKEEAPTVEEITAEYKKLSACDLLKHSEAVLAAAKAIEDGVALQDVRVVKQMTAAKSALLTTEHHIFNTLADLKDARVPVKIEHTDVQVKELKQLLALETPTPKKKAAKSKTKARKKTKK
jgi:hypothetical protein